MDNLLLTAGEVLAAPPRRYPAILRMVRWTISEAILQGIFLVVLAALLPQLIIGGPTSVVLSAIGLTVARAASWPIIYHLAGRLRPALFPILSFALTGLLLVLLSDLVTSIGFGHVHVANVWVGMLVVVTLTAGSTLLGALFSLRDDYAYEWFVHRPLQRKYQETPTSDVPGILFLEIDGLAEPVLRTALAGGWMPTLARLLASGSHTITGWEPDLSSQTSASQAGILLGDNSDIPAYRWYDKASGRLMVSSQMETARAIEQRLSRQVGLLRGGASRWNVFSGDATDSVCTFSTFGDRARFGSSSYLAYFANPYTLPRAIALYFSDVIREWWQAQRQRLRADRPRIRRGFGYAFIRAATTTLMQEAALFMVISDVYRGLPAVYTTFFSYDEVAHHSGIDSVDALKVLATLDRGFAKVLRAIGAAPRPYRLVVLSDHGQSKGHTFRQWSGQTLGDLVSDLVGPGATVVVDQRATEEWGLLNMAISETIEQASGRRSGRLARRALTGRMRDGETMLGPERVARNVGPDSGTDAVVLASGNLGLISFPRWPERMTYEQIVAEFPNLIPGLVYQDGIGFVLVQSEHTGGLVIGRQGVRSLTEGLIDGADPLRPYGKRAAEHLARTNGFSNAPDIMVMSRYDVATGQVFAFEELVGSHGGLGGPQTQPFVLHPASLDAGPGQIVGAVALNRVFQRWRIDLGQDLHA